MLHTSSPRPFPRVSQKSDERQAIWYNKQTNYRGKVNYALTDLRAARHLSEQ